MKITKLFIIFFLFLLAVSGANSQSGKVYLHSVVGEIAPDTITTGEPITFNIAIQNLYFSNVYKFENGFRVYASDGVFWETTTGKFVGPITSPTVMDFLQVSDSGLDGQGADTIGFSGDTFLGQGQGEGIPNGFDTVSWTITIGPIDPKDHGRQICLDSASLLRSGGWLWTLGEQQTVMPDWGEPICFTIVDPSLIQNSPPEIVFIDDVQLTETDTLDYEITATDPENDPITLSVFATNVPSLFLTDSGNGRGSIYWETTYDDEGTYFVTLSAKDPSAAEDTLTFQIFVMNNPRPPVLNPVGDKSVDEDAILQFTVSGFDPDDGTTRIEMTSPHLPIDATFGDPDYGDSTFYWQTTFDDSGTYSATFTIYDADSLSDSETIEIIVNNVNRPPVLNTIGPQLFTENKTEIFVLDAFDPDGPTPIITANNLPSGAELKAGDGTYFEWTPGFDQSGVYDVTFYATDDFDAVDSEVVEITVLDAECPDLTVSEFSLSGPIMVSRNKPVGHRLTASAENLGGASSSPVFAGFYISLDTLIAPPDSLLLGGRESVSSILPGGNSQISINPDMTVTHVPDVFIPSTAYLGLYLDDANTLAECNEENNTSWIEVLLVENIDPILEPIGDTVVNENELLSFTVSASDVDLDSLIFDVYSEEEVEGYEFIDNGDGTGTFSWTPTFDDAGIYHFTFDVFDDTLLPSGSDFEDIIITVNNVNRPPTLNSIWNKLVNEDDSLIFLVSSTDEDNDIMTMSIVNTDLPPGYTFEEVFFRESNSLYAFQWGPTFGQAGIYTATFVATDGVAADSETVTITVTDVACSDLTVSSFTLDGPQEISSERQIEHRLNVTLNNLGPLSVDNQFTLRFYYSDLTDPFDTLGNTYEIGIQTVQSLGVGPFVVDITDSVFMNPDASFGPAYLIMYIDDGSFTDCNPQDNLANIPFELVDNIPSVLDSIGNQVVNEGETLGILLTASDADGDQLEFDYIWHEEVYPNNFSFTDSGNGIAYFEVKPDFNDQGVYDIEFIVRDFYGFKSGGGSFDFEEITITVNNVNRPPQIDSLPDVIPVDENELVSFTVSSLEPDDDCVELSLYSPDLPQEASFNYGDSCQTFGNFNWQTDFADAGTYSAFFVVTDGELADTELVTIMVNDVPCADLSVAAFSIDGPQQISYGREFQQRINLTLENLGPESVDSQFTLRFYYSDLTDPFDLLGNTYEIGIQTVQSLGVGPFVVDITDSVFMNPDASGGPAYLIIYIDEGDYTDCNPQNNLANIPFELVDNIDPILDSIGNKSVDEGQTLSFVVTATDWDNDQLYMEYYQNFESSFDIIFEDSGNGHAYFEWTPGFNDAGEYSFEFYVYDEFKSGSDFEDITITVNDVNRHPVFGPLADTLAVNEGELITFVVSADDPDDDCIELAMISPNLPPEAEFDYVFDCVKTGDFIWTPNFNDAGTYHAIFVASDFNEGSSQDTVVIVVNNVNAAPVFDDIPFVSIDENETFDFDISATDIDGTIPSITTDQLPIGASFVDNGNGSGRFNWTPDCTQNGEYRIRAYATDEFGLVDTGFIELEVGDACNEPLTVVTTPCVQCSPPQFYTDILVTDGDFGILFNNFIDEFSLDGNITINSVRGSELDYYYDFKNRTIVIYSLYGNFEPVDTITVMLSDNIFDLGESNLDSTYNLTYLTGPVVFPGDCNNDGTVNEIDVLSIGLYWNEVGPQRQVGESDPLDFYPQPAHFQQQGSGEWEPRNSVYADVDGSGNVDAVDLCGIAINFGRTVFDVVRATPKENTIQPSIVAAKEVNLKVLEQMREALIECPESAPRNKMLEMIENALKGSEPVLPTEVALRQNYPNPFNPSTTIEFSLPKAEHTTLVIYNMLGQRVATLVDEKVEAGFKTVVWNGTDQSGQAVASGMYFYKLNTESKEIIKRMMLLK